MAFFLPRKRVLEELAKYEKESTRMSKRELERLTKFPGKSEFRERKVGKWVTEREYRQGIEHAESLHKLQHQEAQRLEKRWKHWYRRRRRPLSGFDRFGRWVQRRDSFFSDKDKVLSDVEREFDPKDALAQRPYRDQPRYTAPPQEGSRSASAVPGTVKGAPSSLPAPSVGKGVEGQLFEEAPSIAQEGEKPRRSLRDIVQSRREETDLMSEARDARAPQEPVENEQKEIEEPPSQIPPQYRSEHEEAAAPKKGRRSIRDIIFSRRGEREAGKPGRGRKHQKHGEDRTAALREEEKSRRDADFAKGDKKVTGREEGSSRSSEFLVRHGGMQVLRPSREQEPVQEGLVEPYEWSGVPPSLEGFHGKGKAFQEFVASGATPKTEEEKEREEENIRKARKQREEDARHFIARVVWFLFIFIFVILWVIEIVMFSAWWGWLGTFIGFVLGPFLIPVFPLLALLQQEPGVAIFSLVLIALGGTCLVYAWPEAIRFVRHWRR